MIPVRSSWTVEAGVVRVVKQPRADGRKRAEVRCTECGELGHNRQRHRRERL